MILYICERCGRWMDVSLTTLFTNAFKKIPGVEMPQGQACLNGCGLMRQVLSTDKLCILSDIRSHATGHIEIEYEGKRYRGELFEVKG